MDYKQKKSKEIKPENNNKQKVQPKKKEETKKCLKISNKNGPQKNKNDHYNTIENTPRKKTLANIGKKVKESGKGNAKKNITPKKVQNKKTDIEDEVSNIGRSMSFVITNENEKKNLNIKKEEPKKIKNAAKLTKNPLNKNNNNPLDKKSQEVEVIFTYNFTDTTIQTQDNDKMKDIINKFTQKTEVKRDNVVFLYNGEQINENYSFTQQANELDNNRKKLNILVADLHNNEEPQKSEIISKNFICPECYENITLSLEDYKINYKCKNNHIKNQIVLDEYEKLQKIDLTKIKCEQCEKNTKRDTFNNEFFYCFDCKKNICPLCKNIHDPKHKIFNYDDKNYNCEKHNEQFIEYCQTCEKNLCFLCKNEHTEHKKIDLQTMIIPEEKLLNRFKTTENLINEVKKFVEDIKNKLNDFVKNIDILYKINKNFVDNYDVKKRNYEILQNLKEIYNYNILLNKDLQSISAEELIVNKISNMFQICNKILIKKEQIIYPNGDKYIGELKNNQRNGKGILYYNAKDIEQRVYYEGDWKDDKREGKGIIYWRNNDVYKGDWRDDNIEGKGIFYYGKGDVYDGDWKNNKKEGKGNCSYMSGNKYEGDWINDVVDGKGIYYWSNGNKYIGNFKNGKADGKGVLFYENGEIEIGVYSSGEKIGKYALLDSNGNIFLKKA